MTLLLYAIAGGDADRVDGKGLENQPLRALREESLVAVVSDQERVAAGDREALWQYERVLESLMDRYAILPARYGSRFEGERELRAMIRDRQGQLAAAVDLVRGAVELSVSATWREGQAESSSEQHGSGTTYMLDRLRRHRAAGAIAERLEPLARLARASTHRLLVNDSLPVVGAYLVDREKVQEFASLVGALDGQLDGAELVCTGPWPPYSFADADGR